MSAIDNASPLSQVQSSLEQITQSQKTKIISVVVLTILTLLVLSVCAWANVKVASVYGTGAILNHSIYTTLVPIITSALLLHILAVILAFGNKAKPPDASLEEVVSLPPVVTETPLKEVVAPPPVVVESITELTPMPGKIEAIKCKVGDNVHKGQELCVVEAMKMQIAIRAQESGKVAEIFVTEGAMIGNKQALVRIEKTQE
jgi:biotin carboxyl carrier protein